MEGFEIHFQCWLVVDVNLAAVFFVDLLPPTTIEPSPTLPVTFRLTDGDVDPVQCD